MREFCIRVIENEEGGVTIEGTNKGFTAVEIVAILELKKHDLIRQIEEPTKFVRTVVNEDGSTVDISEKEN